MRRILVLIILVLIFAVLLLVSRSVAGWQHYIIAGDAGMLLYDAFYRWCRDATDETHNWPSTKSGA